MRPLLPLCLLLSACVGLQRTTPTKDDTGAPADSGITVGELSIDVSEVDFGDVSIGMSADRSVTLTNTAGDIARLAAVLDGDGGFTLSDTSITVPGDGTSVLTLGFEPDFAGDYAATLTLSPIDGTDPIAVPVSGHGVDPDDTGSGNGGDNGGDSGGETGGDNGGSTTDADITVSPTSHDYGTLDLGDTANTTFTVRNDGVADLLVSDLRSSDGAFTVTGGTLALPQVLSPGSSKTVQVTFSPSAVRAYNGTLSVISDDPDEGTTAITLTGEGADMCDICAPLIVVDTGGDPYSVTDFISVLGSTDTRSWTIINEGDQDLQVTDVYVNNDAFAPCGEFSTPAFSPTTLSPGSRTRFNISYRATDVCIEVPNPSFDMNVLHILSNDPSQGDYVVELGGGGI